MTHTPCQFKVGDRVHFTDNDYPDRVGQWGTVVSFDSSGDPPDEFLIINVRFDGGETVEGYYYWRFEPGEISEFYRQVQSYIRSELS